jgi:hypothetical protein
MQRLQAAGTHWKILNPLLIILLMAVPLYCARDVQKLDEFDSPSFAIPACVVALVLLPAIEIAWLYFSKAPFKMPAWGRSPFGSDDPLQTLFIGTWCAFAAFLSALLLVPRFGSDYIWTAAIWGCVFVGFFIAQLIAHRVFRTRIENSRN